MSVGIIVPMTSSRPRRTDSAPTTTSPARPDMRDLLQPGQLSQQMRDLVAHVWSQRWQALGVMSKPVVVVACTGPQDNNPEAVDFMPAIEVASIVWSRGFPDHAKLLREVDTSKCVVVLFDPSGARLCFIELTDIIREMRASGEAWTIQNLGARLGASAELVEQAKAQARHGGMGSRAPQAWRCPGDTKDCGFMADMADARCKQCGHEVTVADLLGVPKAAS